MSRAHRILLAIDDPALFQTLAEHLRAGGHDVTALADGEPAALVVVDDRWPGCQDLCRRLKATARPPTLLMLGFGCPAADAVVAKPLRLNALLAKVTELLARVRGTPTIFHLGRWRFDAAARLLRSPDGAQVRLTDKETAILALLAGDGGTVARERLLAEVWGYSSSLSTHTLETHIYRLRRKIEADPTRAEILLTEDGGYRLALA